MLRLENTDAHTTQNILRHHLNRRPENIWARYISNIVATTDNIRSLRMSTKNIIQTIKRFRDYFPSYNMTGEYNTPRFHEYDLPKNSVNEDIIHCAKLPYIENIAVWYLIRRGKRYQAGDAQPVRVTVIGDHMTVASPTEVNAIEVLGITREDGSVHVTEERALRALAQLRTLSDSTGGTFRYLSGTSLIGTNRIREEERRETVRGRVIEIFAAYPYTIFGSPDVNTTKLPTALRNAFRGVNRLVYINIHKELFSGVLARSLSNNRWLIRKSLNSNNKLDLLLATISEVERAIEVWRNIICPHLVEANSNAD